MARGNRLPDHTPPRGRRRAWLCAGLIFALGGAASAAVGPNFTPPQAAAPTVYAGARDATPALAPLTDGAGAAGPWWKALGSPALDEVMSRALTQNPSLAAAEATLEKVRAQAQREKATLGPSVNGAASYTRERINFAALGFPGFPSPTLNLYSIGPSVSYDLDLAGGGRRRVEAARAAARAQAYRTDAAYLTLTGDVALQAVALAAYRAQSETIEAVIADDRRTIDIVRQAEAAGGEAPSAARGGELQLAQDLALLPPLAEREAQARHALALLLGEAPSQARTPDFKLDDFRPPASIPVALPSALVHRRPDIQAAEADLHVDTALIGAQTARLYPDVRIAASFSQGGVTPGSLFAWAATGYNFGPQLTLPIFDGGAIRADRRAAIAQARASLARYRQTVVTAFVQVADVLSDLAEDEARLATLAHAEETAHAAVVDARSAYDLGGGSLASVVVAERQWRRASLARVEAIGERLADIVDLYGATASDWRESDAKEGVKSLASAPQSP